MAAKRKTSKTAPIPDSRERALRRERVQRTTRVFKRLLAQAEKARDDLKEIGPTGGTVARIDMGEIVPFIINVIRLVLTAVEACSNYYDTMNAAADVLDNPSSTPAQRDQANELISGAIEGAGKMGCP